MELFRVYNAISRCKPLNTDEQNNLLLHIYEELKIDISRYSEEQETDVEKIKRIDEKVKQKFKENISPKDFNKLINYAIHDNNNAALITLTTLWTRFVGDSEEYKECFHRILDLEQIKNRITDICNECYLFSGEKYGNPQYTEFYRIKESILSKKLEPKQVIQLLNQIENRSASKETVEFTNYILQHCKEFGFGLEEINAYAKEKYFLSDNFSLAILRNYEMETNEKIRKILKLFNYLEALNNIEQYNISNKDIIQYAFNNEETKLMRYLLKNPEKYQLTIEEFKTVLLKLNGYDIGKDVINYMKYLKNTDVDTYKNIMKEYLGDVEYNDELTPILVDEKQMSTQKVETYNTYTIFPGFIEQSDYSDVLNTLKNLPQDIKIEIVLKQSDEEKVEELRRKMQENGIDTDRLCYYMSIISQEQQNLNTEEIKNLRVEYGNISNIFEQFKNLESIHFSSKCDKVQEFINKAKQNNFKEVVIDIDSINDYNLFDLLKLKNIGLEIKFNMLSNSIKRDNKWETLWNNNLITLDKLIYLQTKLLEIDDKYAEILNECNIKLVEDNILEVKYLGKNENFEEVIKIIQEKTEMSISINTINQDFSYSFIKGKKHEQSEMLDSLDKANLPAELEKNIYFKKVGNSRCAIIKVNNINNFDEEQWNKLRNLPIDVEVECKGKEFPDSYEIDKYIEIRKKLGDMVAGIDMNLPEEERFCEIYKRLCNYAIYDIPAAYPKNEAEEEYKKKVRETCRNLENIILDGKCVCGGYATALNALCSLVGIESEYVIGDCHEEEVTEKQLKQLNPNAIKVIKHKENGNVVIKHCHAWNRVKLNGKWYNVDATWDEQAVKNNCIPRHCFKTDEWIEKKEGKTFKIISDHECNTEFPQEKLDELFNEQMLLLNGKISIPASIFGNIKNFIQDIREGLAEIGRDIKISRREKIKALQAGNMEKTDSSKNENDKHTWDLSNWPTNSAGNIEPTISTPEKEKDNEEEK